MTELEKIQYTKDFIDKLAKGINPVDDSIIPDGEVATNKRVLGCFSYVSDILEQVIENGGIKKPKKQRKSSFALSDEMRQNIKISENPIQVRDIVGQLNGMVNLDEVKRISAASVNDWLVEIELLYNSVDQNGKNRRLPTEHGKAMGIMTVEREGEFGKYTAVFFDSVAQQFVFDNIDAIIEKKAEENDKLSEYHARKWYPEQDEKLTQMFRSGATLKEMSYALKRTDGGIRSRLKRLGLVENKYDVK